MTKDNKRGASRSLAAAARDVLLEAQNLGPKVAYADPPKKLNSAPEQGGEEDMQNNNNVAKANIGGLRIGAREKTGYTGGGNTGETDSHGSYVGTKRLNPDAFQGDTEDLGGALTDAEGEGQDVPPSMRGNDHISRTSKVPGGNYPAQEKYNPTDKKIFAEAEEKEDDEDEDENEDEDEKKMKASDKEDEGDDEDEKEDDEDEDKMKKEDMELVASQVIEDSLAEANISEHMAAMFSNGGADLSEEFMERATVVFEAAVREVSANMFERLNSHFVGALAEAVETYQNSLTEQVDSYLGYVVEQWISENEVAIESGLRAELTEDFIRGLHKLFVENYIDVPAEKVDVIESLSAKIDELEERLDEEFSNNVSLRDALIESRKVEAFNAAIRGMTDVQADKLAKLAEGISTKNPDDFEEKLFTLKESYFSAPVVKAAGPRSSLVGLDSVEPSVRDGNTGKMLTEQVEQELNPRMQRYAEALGRQVKSPTYSGTNS
jgi:hypothetical protein